MSNPTEYCAPHNARLAAYLDAGLARMNIAACIVSVVALPPIVLGLAVSGYLTDGGEPVPADVPIYACEFEDGYGQDVCYWDADLSGNGEGRSFVKVGDTYHYYCND